MTTTAEIGKAQKINALCDAQNTPDRPMIFNQQLCAPGGSKPEGDGV